MNLMLVVDHAQSSAHSQAVVGRVVCGQNFVVAVRWTLDWRNSMYSKEKLSPTSFLSTSVPSYMCPMPFLSDSSTYKPNPMYSPWTYGHSAHVSNKYRTLNTKGSRTRFHHPEARSPSRTRFWVVEFSYLPR